MHCLHTKGSKSLVQEEGRQEKIVPVIIQESNPYDKGNIGTANSFAWPLHQMLILM